MVQTSSCCFLTATTPAALRHQDGLAEAISPSLPHPMLLLSGICQSDENLAQQVSHCGAFSEAEERPHFSGLPNTCF